MRPLACFYLLIFIGLFLSCKPRNYSQVKHDFGSTSRVDADHKFDKCETSYESLKRFPKTHQYIKSIANYIMEKNPQTFKGNLAPENFCINIRYDSNFNAEARQENREVVINTGAILAMGNDAALAAVMAHELSHITMLHRYSNHPKFIADKESLGLIQQAGALTRRVSSVSIEMNKARDSILVDLEKIEDNQEMILIQNQLLSIFDDFYYAVPDNFSNVNIQDYTTKRTAFLEQLPANIVPDVKNKMDSMLQKLIDTIPDLKKYIALSKKMENKLVQSPEVGIEEGMNWQEQEADEVGFEFYRRAGFRDTDFFNMLNTLATTAGNMHSEDVISCMRASFKAIHKKDSSFEPDRGMGTHPETCWRIFDHLREEVLHEDDYNKFKNDLVILSVAGLSDARTEILADPRLSAQTFNPMAEEIQISLPPAEEQQPLPQTPSIPLPANNGQ